MINLLGEFPSDDNKHLMLVESQIGKMKKGEGKHIELDDRYCAFVKSEGDDRYTGWIYMTSGAIPCMTFENATTRQIVADAYEQYIFSNESAGSLYNRFTINDINDNMATNELEKFANTGTEIIQDSTPGYLEVSPATEGLDHRSVTMEDMGNGMICIRIMKSIAANLVEKYPEFSASEIVDILKSRSDKLSKGSKDNLKNKVDTIRENLKELIGYHKKGDTKKVISHHEKIDSALHSLVGKEGLTSEEKD